MRNGRNSISQMNISLEKSKDKEFQNDFGSKVFLLKQLHIKDKHFLNNIHLNNLNFDSNSDIKILKLDKDEQSNLID